MAQLCLLKKIRAIQWLFLGASAFQSMSAGFLCVKCDNFACLHTRQDRNKLHLKIWFFFAKIDIFRKLIADPLPSVVQAYTQTYSFGGRITLIIYQIRHELSVTIHKISSSWKTKRYIAALESSFECGMIQIELVYILNLAPKQVDRFRWILWSR